MKNLTLLILLILFVSCKKEQNEELYKNYVAALNNESTFQYHIVIKFKNLNTGEIREICTEANFLKGALHRESKMDYDDYGRNKILSEAIKNKERYFEFKNDSAMMNMGIQDYTMEDMKNLEKKVNFDSIVNLIKKKKKWSIGLDDKEMMMYAHALFNRGILTGENNCMGGILVYVDRNKPPF